MRRYLTSAESLRAKVVDESAISQGDTAIVNHVISRSDVAQYHREAIAVQVPELQLLVHVLEVAEFDAHQALIQCAQSCRLHLPRRDALTRDTALVFGARHTPHLGLESARRSVRAARHMAHLPRELGEQIEHLIRVLVLLVQVELQVRGLVLRPLEFESCLGTWLAISATTAVVPLDQLDAPRALLVVGLALYIREVLAHQFVYTRAIGLDGEVQCAVYGQCRFIGLHEAQYVLVIVRSEHFRHLRLALLQLDCLIN